MSRSCSVSQPIKERDYDDFHQSNAFFKLRYVDSQPCQKYVTFLAYILQKIVGLQCWVFSCKVELALLSKGQHGLIPMLKKGTFSSGFSTSVTHQLPSAPPSRGIPLYQNNFKYPKHSNFRHREYLDFAGSCDGDVSQTFITGAEGIPQFLLLLWLSEWAAPSPVPFSKW